MQCNSTFSRNDCYNCVRTDGCGWCEMNSPSAGTHGRGSCQAGHFNNEAGRIRTCLTPSLLSSSSPSRGPATASGNSSTDGTWYWNVCPGQNLNLVLDIDSGLTDEWDHRSPSELLSLLRHLTKNCYTRNDPTRYRRQCCFYRNNNNNNNKDYLAELIPFNELGDVASAYLHERIKPYFACSPAQVWSNISYTPYTPITWGGWRMYCRQGFLTSSMVQDLNLSVYTPLALGFVIALTFSYFRKPQTSRIERLKPAHIFENIMFIITCINVGLLYQTVDIFSSTFFKHLTSGACTEPFPIGNACMNVLASAMVLISFCAFSCAIIAEVIVLSCYRDRRSSLLNLPRSARTTATLISGTFIFINSIALFILTIVLLIDQTRCGWESYDSLILERSQSKLHFSFFTSIIGLAYTGGTGIVMVLRWRLYDMSWSDGEHNCSFHDKDRRCCPCCSNSCCADGEEQDQDQDQHQDREPGNNKGKHNDKGKDKDKDNAANNTAIPSAIAIGSQYHDYAQPHHEKQLQLQADNNEAIGIPIDLIQPYDHSEHYHIDPSMALTHR